MKEDADDDKNYGEEKENSDDYTDDPEIKSCLCHWYSWKRKRKHFLNFLILILLNYVFLQSTSANEIFKGVPRSYNFRVISYSEMVHVLRKSSRISTLLWLFTSGMAPIFTFTYILDHIPVWH